MPASTSSSVLNGEKLNRTALVTLGAQGAVHERGGGAGAGRVQTAEGPRSRSLTVAESASPTSSATTPPRAAASRRP